MLSAYDNLMRIVDGTTPSDQRTAAMMSFARELDWTPSYDFHNSFGVDAAEDHLVVEHGLDTSAVISFLKAPNRAAELSAEQMRSLLMISYNNLVEWHIFISENEVRYVNNISKPLQDRLAPLTRTNFQQQLSSLETGNLLLRQSTASSLPSCDDAFIMVVSRWKRLLKADYKETIDNRSISAFFNALIFTRGCEDSRRTGGPEGRRLLLELLDQYDGETVNMVTIISDALNQTGINQPLGDFVDIQQLNKFNKLHTETARDLVRDLYRPTNAPYSFNFALLSKHALSRIYERYVALLDFDDDQGQLSFINVSPTERAPQRTGTVYTPQFIAGFFARFIQDNMTPRAFRLMQTIDPACGSGIFLRTILEHQCNPLISGVTKATIQGAFKSVQAIDRDPNACEATRLSLTLLYLVATNMLPVALNVQNGDAISLAVDQKIAEQSYDAVLANPPYIKLDHLNEAERSTYKDYLGAKRGRIDSYLAFVKLCLTCAKPGGFVCLVLPQVFLLARNAGELRRQLCKEFVIRCIVDLTAVPVFGDVGTYSVLLIVQRSDNASDHQQMAQLVKVQEFVGPALQACLDKRIIDTPY